MQSKMIMLQASYSRKHRTELCIEVKFGSRRLWSANNVKSSTLRLTYTCETTILSGWPDMP